MMRVITEYPPVGDTLTSAIGNGTWTSSSGWRIRSDGSTGTVAISDLDSQDWANRNGYSISLGNGVDNILIYKGEPMRYLYKAYVIDEDDDITEVEPFIAKDEVSAKVKAILKAEADPDTAHVILQRLGEVPKAEKKDE